MKTENERYVAAVIILRQGTPLEEIPKKLLRYATEKQLTDEEIIKYLSE